MGFIVHSTKVVSLKHELNTGFENLKERKWTKARSKMRRATCLYQDFIKDRKNTHSIVNKEDVKKIYIFRGIIAYYTGEWKEAIEEWEWARKIDKHLPFAIMLWYTIAALKLKEPHRAKELLEESISYILEDMDNIVMYSFLLAILEHNGQRFKKALKWIQKSLKLATKTTQQILCYILKGDTYKFYDEDNIKYAKRSLKAYQKAVKLSSKATPLIGRGFIEKTGYNWVNHLIDVLTTFVPAFTSLEWCKKFECSEHYRNLSLKETMDEMRAIFNTPETININVPEYPQEIKHIPAKKKVPKKKKLARPSRPWHTMGSLKRSTKRYVKTHHIPDYHNIPRRYAKPWLIERPH